MRNIFMALLFITVVLTVKAYSVVLTEEQIQSKADEYYTKYKFEWDYILKDKNKNNIKKSYIRGSADNRGYAAAISDFLESRGGMDSHMVNIYLTKSYVNKKGRTVRSKVNMDCGRYGINTRTYAHYADIKHSRSMAIDICYALKTDVDLNYKQFEKTIEIAEKRYIKKGYTGRTLFRKIMNYYNSGRDAYTGEQYIKAIALVRMFREVF